MEIELANAVEALRDELLTAAVRGAGQEIAFEVGPIEMEFAVELRADATVKAGFKAWVLASAEAEAGVGRTRMHRVTLTLTPKRPGGGDLLISAASAEDFGPGDVSGRIGR